ncbi:MAG: tyrosine-type recombinase/integrase [Bacteriovoracaceae bacterium]
MELISSSFSIINNGRATQLFNKEHREDIALFFYNLSPNTLNAYKYDLDLFFRFLEMKGLVLYQARQIHIEEYMKFVSMHGGNKARKCSDRTYNRKLSAIKSFFKYLCEKRILETDPCSFVRFRKIPLVVETEFISSEKIRELFALIPSDTLRYKRDRALLGVLFYSGCRVSELRNLKIKDYGFYAHGRTLDFVTKGNEKRQIPVPQNLAEVMNDYLQARLSEMEYFEGDALFTNLKSNSPLYRSSINDIFEKWSRKLGLPYRVSPHSARTSFIVMMDENRVDLKKQAETVGHKNVAMTIAYNKKRQMLDKSPVLDIQLL